MANTIPFARLETSLPGLMTRAVRYFDRYLEERPDLYHWVCVDNPEKMAKTFEILAEDLPEEDLAQLAASMPYLILLFHRADSDRHIPVEATLAFLSVLNRSGLVTILRQASDKATLAPSFNLDAREWEPVFFLVGGVPDLDAAHAEDIPSHCSFF